jgi:hypothetical protein
MAKKCFVNESKHRFVLSRRPQNNKLRFDFGKFICVVSEAQKRAGISPALLVVSRQSSGKVSLERMTLVLLSVFSFSNFEQDKSKRIIRNTKQHLWGMAL